MSGQQEQRRFDVTVTNKNGHTTRHENLSDQHATEIERDALANPNNSIVTVKQRTA